MSMRIKNFKDFHENENHSNILSPDEIIDYLEKITPTPEGLPHQSWIDSIKNCNSNFVLKEIKIQDILEMDPNIAGYVKAKGNRYEFEKDLDLKNLENPIIILDGQVLDGYNRISVKHKNGDKKIKAYIAESKSSIGEPSGADHIYLEKSIK